MMVSVALLMMVWAALCMMVSVALLMMAWADLLMTVLVGHATQGLEALVTLGLVELVLDVLQFVSNCEFQSLLILMA
jgi:hypothetical protein